MGDCSIYFIFRSEILTLISVVSSLGVAFVGFGSEKELDQAYGRNKNFLGGKRIFLKKTQTELTTEEVKEDVPRPWELKQQEDDAEQEGIAETGRLFVRNLPYSCTEEDLEEKFKKFD